MLHHIYICFPFKPGSSSPLKTAPKHLSYPLGSICDSSHTLCPVRPIPTCCVPSSPLPPGLPLPPPGHAGAYVPSLSLPALPDLDLSSPGPLHPGALHLLLVRGHPQGGQAPLPVARQNEELWSEQQRALHHRYWRIHPHLLTERRFVKDHSSFLI